MTNPTKEIPYIKEEKVENGIIKLTERFYKEKISLYPKEKIQNYLNEAKNRRDEAQEEFDKWEDLLNQLNEK